MGVGLPSERVRRRLGIWLSVLAFGVFFVFGAHAFVWGTTAHSIRQRAVPEEFQGRVGSVYMMGVQGGIVVGSAVGGIVARDLGCHRTVLVRVRRVGPDPRGDLA